MEKMEKNILPLYHPPAVQPPTVDQLQAISHTLRLDISPDDMQQYQSFMSGVLEVYNVVDKLNETMPNSNKYMSFTGCPPSPAKNRYNAWSWMTNIVGSGSGKLVGKTVAIKDCMNIAGTPLSCGSKFMRGFVSSYNATVVSRILDAGGAIKGKSTCEDMCFSGNSFSACTGPVLNPYDATHSAGGTSSGSAVLVATGEVDMAIGTDSAGSIRMPACWCGIVGMKPSRGLTPYTGIIPHDRNMDNVGPMAKTVYDCALLLEVMAGYDGGLDPCQSPHMKTVNYTEHLSGDIGGLRIGILKDGFIDCETDVAETVKDAANSLKQLGAIVDEFSWPLHDQALAVGTIIIFEGTFDSYMHGGLTALNLPGFKDSTTHDFLFNALRSAARNLPTTVKHALLMASYIRENYGCRFYAKAVNMAREIAAAYDELFNRYDVIVLPTIKFKAPKLPTVGLTVGQYLADTLFNATNVLPYNVIGAPALSINAGFSPTSPRLPIGMMIAGRLYDDVTVLRVAHAFEKLRDSSASYISLEDSLRRGQNA